MAYPRSLREVYRPPTPEKTAKSTDVLSRGETYILTAKPIPNFDPNAIGPGKYENANNAPTVAGVCGELDPVGCVYICTRHKGHEGEHEAQYTNGNACCEPWPNNG